MRIRLNLFAFLLGPALALATLAVASSTLRAQQTPASSSAPNDRQGPRGMGSFPGNGRGILGAVTAVAADHYVIKTDSGESYTIHFSVNTRIMKQPAGRPRSAQGKGTGESGEGERAAPQPLKPTEIKVGDVITAGGEIDVPNKSVGAVFIFQVDLERARQMREMQANYGKTWLAGKITGIDGTKITIDGMIDHTPHAIEVDENTSFRQRRDSITLADIQPGQQLRAEGAMKNGVFLATVVNAAMPRDSESGGPEHPRGGPVAPASATPKP